MGPTEAAAAAQAALGSLPLSALKGLVESAVAAPAVATADEKAVEKKADDTRADEDTTASAAPTTTTNASPSRVPSDLRTGLRHGLPSEHVIEGLRLAATAALQATVQVPLQEEGKTTEGETSGPETTSGGQPSDGWSEAQRDWVEMQCTKLVGSLRSEPVESAQASGGKEQSRRPARRKSDFGAGLARGFLNAPRRRRAKVEGKAEGKAEGKSVPPAASAETSTMCSSRNVCKTCDVRLPLTAHLGCGCKCGHVFCTAHLHCHDCEFDHRSIHKRKLAAANPKLSAPKLDAIL